MRIIDKNNNEAVSYLALRIIRDDSLAEQLVSIASDGGATIALFLNTFFHS